MCGKTQATASGGPSAYLHGYLIGSPPGPHIASNVWGMKPWNSGTEVDSQTPIVDFVTPTDDFPTPMVDFPTSVVDVPAQTLKIIGFS